MTRRLAVLFVGLVALIGASGPAFAGESPHEVSPRSFEGDIEIFMNVRATDEQIQAVRDAIVASPEIETFAFLDKADAYRVFKKIFRSDPDLVENIDRQSLPTSFRLTLTDRNDTQTVLQRFKALDGVDDVVEKKRPADLVAETCADYEHAKEIRDDLEIEIFMEVNASESEIEAVRRQLNAAKGVASIRYLDKEDAFEVFKNIFRSDPELIEDVKPESLPASFKVTLKSASALRDVTARFDDADGVSDIATPGKAIEEFDGLRETLEDLCG